MLLYNYYAPPVSMQEMELIFRSLVRIFTQKCTLYAHKFFYTHPLNALTTKKKKKIKKTHFANFKGSLCCIIFCTLSNRLERRKKKIHLSTVKNGFFHYYVATQFLYSTHLSNEQGKLLFFPICNYIIHTFHSRATDIAENRTNHIDIEPDFLLIACN